MPDPQLIDTLSNALTDRQGHHGTGTPIRSSQPMAVLKLMLCKHRDQEAGHPCARPNCTNRLRRWPT